VFLYIFRDLDRIPRHFVGSTRNWSHDPLALTISHFQTELNMANHYFFIVSEHNPNLCLDISGGSKDKGAKLITWDYHGGENQRFRFNDKGYITSVHSGLVLDVEGGVHQGNHIIQWESKLLTFRNDF
jgi:hypothetical protein